MEKQIICLVMILLLTVSGCAKNMGLNTSEDTAENTADKLLYKPVTYANQNKQGPALIVIPGSIKSNNAGFLQTIKPNNIADYAEFELGKANFRVLARGADLGPLLDEISLAVHLGDPIKVRNILKTKKLKTTQWFVRFDIIKFEKVAETNERKSVPINILLEKLRFPGKEFTDNVDIGTKQSAEVWIVGLRYKVLNANTTEQVAQGYFERKMKSVQNSASAILMETNQKNQVNLDTMAQRLIQVAVADLDQKK